MTTNEEKAILERCGRENPFRVPAGYFDTLPQQVMSNLPRKRNTIRLWQRVAVAAVLSGFVAIGGFMLFNSAYSNQAKMAEQLDAEYMDEMLDYSMVGNMEIATYLTEAE